MDEASKTKSLTTYQKIKKIICLSAKLLCFVIKNDIKKEQINLRFWYILSFGVGILNYFFLHDLFKIIVPLFAVLLIFLSFFFNYLFNKQNKIVIFFLLFFSFGFGVAYIHFTKHQENHFNSPEYNITFDGKVESIRLTSKENILILTPISVPNTELYNGKIRIKYNPILLANKSLNNGDIVNIKTSLIPIKYSSFPQDRSYENYAKFFDIIASGTAKEIKIINQNYNQKTLSKKFATQNKRNEIQKRIYEVNKHSPGAGIVIAVLTGNNSFIPTSQLADIRHSGCAHILAISGLHMSIVVAFVFAIFVHFFAFFPSIALRYNTKKLAVIPAMMTCFFYLNIANVPISATRSFLMVLIASITLLLNRKNASLNTLFITFFVMLCFAPHNILSPSFQMSFMAVFGLISLYNNNFLVENILFSKHRNIVIYIFGILLSSIVATISTIFFEIYHFKQYAWIGLISNIPVIPIIEFLVLPLGFIGMIFNGTWFGDVFYLASGFFANVVCHITNWTANLPYSFLTTKQMTNNQLSIIILGVIISFLSRSKILKISGLMTFITGLLMYLFEAKFVLVYNKNLKNIVFLENDKYYSVDKIKSEYLYNIWSQNLGVKEISPMSDNNKNIKCSGERKNKNMSCKYSINGIDINIFQENSDVAVGVKIKNKKPIFIEK